MLRLRFYQIKINDTSMTIPNITGWFLAQLIENQTSRPTSKKRTVQFMVTVKPTNLLYPSTYNFVDSSDASHKESNVRNNYVQFAESGTNSTLISGLLDIPKGRFHLIVEPSLCMAFGSCETLAPKVFVVEKNKRINPKAKVVSEVDATFDEILSAAQTCPTKAIKIIDRYTGEQIYP